MPQDLLAPKQPRDLLADTPAPVEQDGGVLGDIGDWIIDNTVGGVSADMLENARSGTFQQDAAQDEGLLDYIGSKLERGGAWFDRGIYDVLGGLGSQKAREAANALDRGTVSQAIAGDTGWEDVKDVSSLGKFIGGSGVESLPAMGVLAVPWVGPLAVGASQTGNIARERAANDGGGEVTRDLLGEALLPAVASTYLDRLGLKGIKNPVGNTVTGRIAGAATREGLTEAAQSGIEYAGGTAGTERGFDLFEMGDQMLAGGIAGAGLGAGFRGGAEIAQPVVSRVGKVRGQNQPVAGARQDEDFDGSLDDLLRGETEPRDLLALPSPEMVQRREAAPVARPIPPAPVAAAPDFAAVKAAIRVPESGGNDNVTNRAGSSASGRYQFIESTFKNLYQRVYGVTPAMADQAWQKKRFDVDVQERLMDELLEENAATLRAAGVEPDTGNLYVAHFAGAARAARLAKADPNAPVSQFFNKQEIAQNQSYLGGGKTVGQALEIIRGKVGGAGTGSVAPDIAAIDIPGADGSLLGRGEGQGRIANLDIPEASPEQREAGRATPIDIDFGSEAYAQGRAEREAGNVARFNPNRSEADEAAFQAGLRGVQPPATPAPLNPLPPAQAVGNISQVTTARGDMVDTQFELRDLPELIQSSSPEYDQALQPRDRASRATSGAQVASIAANLDPAQLGDSRLASTGAPIIGPDGQVESGNGRIAAIQLAYQQQPERAQAYRQMIEAQGFDTGGMQNPVLVRRRTTEMTPEQRQAWTRAANERDTMAMSSTEQASADARALDDAVLSMYRGGAVTAAANRDFVRAFIQKAVSPAERNAMTASDGSISADGVRRVRFALLARAYGDTELIARISEDTDTNIAAIGKALLEAAPAFARMKAKIASGDIPAQYDISPNIAEAARLVSRSRETGQSIAGMLAQTDAFSEPPAPETVEVLRTFFRDEGMKRPRSGMKVADILIDYAREVDALGDRAKQGDDMFGNAPQMPPPAEVLRDARELLDGGQGGQDGQRDLLANPPENAIPVPDEQGNRSDGQPAAVRPDQGEPDGGPDRAVPTLARGQLRALGITQELRARSSAALIGRTASTPKELAEIAQIYRDPRYETFRIFYTKGDEIVHATGVSTRSIAEAAIMPEDMSYGEFLAEIERTKKRSGADGYYLLHNHPSGRPDPSPADKTVTRQIATSVEGFRGHVVINSGKFAEIQVDKAGRSRTNIRDLNLGEDKLLKPSVPHNAIGSVANSSIRLAILAKNLQKPGYVTVIGTDAGAKVRVIVEFADSTVKKDVKTLMAMGRRIMRQSGSASLFLVGDRDVLSSPVVSRALKAGMVTAAFDNDGRPMTTKQASKNKMPTRPSRYVAEDQSAFANTIEVDGKQRPTQNSNGQPIAKDDESLRNFWRWFGDSKVVDAQGRPLVVYHGAPDARDITGEDGSFKSLDQRFGGDKQGVHWFAKDQSTARTYADDRRAFDYQAADPDVIPAYLRLINPEDVDGGMKEWMIAQARGRTSNVIDEAQADGRDGVIIRNVLDDYNQTVGSRSTTTYAVFSDTQIKSVNNRGTFDPLDPAILREETTPFNSNDAFERWAGVPRSEVIAPDEINDFDFNGPGPFVMRGYHGTTHEFEAFNASVRGNKEGQFGAVNYFTSSKSDADGNYAGEGPDLTSRIEQMAERIEQESDGEVDMEDAREQARAALAGGKNQTLEVFIRTERPFIVGSDDSPWIEFTDFEKLEQEAIERVADDEGLTADEVRANRDDYEEQIDEARWDIEADTPNALFNAVEKVAARYDLDAQEIYGQLADTAAVEGTRHNRLEDILRQTDALAYVENPEDGGLIGFHVLGDIIRELGFDSIIMKNAAVRFSNMKMDRGTAHIHVFDQNNTNIKSVNNRGTFDAEDPRILREAKEPWSEGAGEPEGGPQIIDKLVDRDGLKRDAQAIRDAVGNPLDTLKGIAEGSMAEMGRAFFYSMDSRMRVMAKRFNSPTITKLANMFHAEAGKSDNPVGETYHEAVEREGFGRASRAWRILEPFFNDKEAMDRIGMMLRNPGEKRRGRMAEAKAAAEIAKLLKDTIDYRKKAGEDIGEVTDGYFPRWMDVEKVMANRDLFLRQATELYRKHGAEDPEGSAKAWLARIFDQYAGLDGGMAYAGLFHDTRPAGVGRKTTKAREFGKDADKLLGQFYSNDAGEVLTAYFIGAARKAEEARRFGDEKLRRMMNQIKSEMRRSGEDPGDALDSLAKMIDTNLGRVDALGEKMRSATSLLHTAGQLGTLDRATVTSLSEAMMGFVRAGPKYGIPMIRDSVREFVRNVRGKAPSEIARLAEALGIVEDVMVGDTLAARAGFERSQTTNRASKIQRGFFQATGLHQWTEGTRTAATRMGQAFIRNNAEDALQGKNRGSEALRELGIKDPRAFGKWLRDGGDVSVDGLTSSKASPEQEQYRAALMRFVNQTIMKPTKAQKPRWASTPYGALVFSLMSFSYGFKKNVLDRVARQTKDAVKTKDMSLLYPAFGLAGLLAAHTVINNVLRQAIFGGGREDDEEGISGMDVLEAVDRAGLTAAASRPLNAAFSLRYQQGIVESMMGPVIGRPADLLERLWTASFGENSENTNTAERAAAGAVYDVVLEPALEAYGVTRFKKPLAAAVVWGSGNREGGAVPADRDYFVDALAGEKPD